jgi:hypothetical protein
MFLKHLVLYYSLIFFLFLSTRLILQNSIFGAVVPVNPGPSFLNVIKMATGVYLLYRLPPMRCLQREKSGQVMLHGFSRAFGCSSQVPQRNFWRGRTVDC